MGLSPKRTAESGIVTIFHLSYPKGSPDSLNAHIPTEAFTLQYICIDVDVAISLVLEHGPGCFMRKKKKKKHIQSGFCIIPVHPHDWELQGMVLKGQFFFDKAFPFELRSAPYLFNQLSYAREWLVKKSP